MNKKNNVHSIYLKMDKQTMQNNYIQSLNIDDTFLHPNLQNNNVSTQSQNANPQQNINNQSNINNNSNANNSNDGDVESMLSNLLGGNADISKMLGSNFSNLLNSNGKNQNALSSLLPIIMNSKGQDNNLLTSLMSSLIKKPLSKSQNKTNTQIKTKDVIDVSHYKKI